MAKTKKLRPAHQRFADEYLKDFNATAAYRRAGYAARGNSAEVNAVRLLRKAQVAAYIESKRQALAEKADISTEATLRETARIAFADIGRLFDADGRLKPINEIDPDTRAAIASIDSETLYEGTGKDRRAVGTIVKVRLWSKTDALEKLMKHLGMYEKDNRQKTDPIRALLEAIDGRNRFAPQRHTP